MLLVTDELILNTLRHTKSGRGLRTVAVLAESWGWHGNGQSRTVTAVFAVPAAKSVA